MGYVRCFLLDPFENPFFAREWRRSQRRFGRLGEQPIPSLAILALSFAVLCVTLLVASQPLLTTLPHGTLATVMLLWPTVLGSMFGFFVARNAAVELSDPSFLSELRMTPLHAQDIAFGVISGFVLPFSLILLMLLPGLALYGIDMVIRHSARSMLEGFGLLLLLVGYYPFALSGMLASAAVAAGLTLGRATNNTTLLQSLAVWLLLGLCTSGIYFAVCLLGWPVNAFVGMWMLVFCRLGIAGAFLHHLAIRIALEAEERED
jgi:hypothetical protein